MYRVLYLLIFLNIPSAFGQSEIKVLPLDGAANDDYGRMVSINEDFAIVGAPRDDDKGIDSGSAYIYERQGSVWTEANKVTASDGVFRDDFGFSVSIAGSFAIVGAPGDDDNGLFQDRRISMSARAVSGMRWPN